MSFELVNKIANDSLGFIYGDKINPQSPNYKDLMELNKEFRYWDDRIKRLENSWKIQDTVFKNEEQYLERINELTEKRNSVQDAIRKITGDPSAMTITGYSYDADPANKPKVGQANLGDANIVFSDARWGKLSNLADHTFEWNGRNYRSVEHAYQSNKSGEFHEPTYRAYNDRPAARKINTGPPANKETNLALMEDLYRTMLNQNPEMVDLLLETEGFNITHKLNKEDIWTTEMPRILTKLRDEFKNPVTEVKPVERVGIWTRAEVEADKAYTYLFGDNTADRLSGVVPTQTQAVIRGLDNAVGIDTRLSRTEDWVDTDANYNKFTQHVDEQIQKALDRGKPIKVSSGGMGTGMAKALPARFKAYLDNAIKNIGTSNTSRIVPKDTPGSVLAMRGGDLPNPFYYQGGGPDAIVRISEGSTEANIAKVVELHKNWLETGAVPDGLTDDQIKRLAEMREKQLNIIDRLPNDYKLGYYKPDATTSHAITLDNFIQERKKNNTGGTVFNVIDNPQNLNHYVNRTKYNYANSDITFDFSTVETGTGAGHSKGKGTPDEGLKWNWVKVDNSGRLNLTNMEEVAIAQKLADALTSGQTINIAGHGNYTSTRGGLTQSVNQRRIDETVEIIFKKAMELVGDKPITGKVISGGQTGFDEAGIFVARNLGIPTEVNVTEYTFRDSTGEKVNVENEFKARINRTNRFGPGGAPPLETPGFDFDKFFQDQAEIKKLSQETNVPTSKVKKILSNLPGFIVVPFEQMAEIVLKNTSLGPAAALAIQYDVGLFLLSLLTYPAAYAQEYFRLTQGGLYADDINDPYTTPNMQAIGNAPMLDPMNIGLTTGAPPDFGWSTGKEIMKANPVTEEDLNYVIDKDAEGNDFTVKDAIKELSNEYASQQQLNVINMMLGYQIDKLILKHNPDIAAMEDVPFTQGGWKYMFPQQAYIQKGVKHLFNAIVGTNGR